MKSFRLIALGSLLVAALALPGCKLTVEDDGDETDANGKGGSADDDGGAGGEEQGGGGNAGEGAGKAGSGGEEAGAAGAATAGAAGAEPTTPTGISIVGSEASGDVVLSGQLGVEEGDLQVTIATIKDPEDETKPADPDNVTFDVTIDGEAVTCEITGIESTDSTAVDIVFINDTTGSMAGTVTGIADSIKSFASTITKKGVDARFAMITYGDAFSTIAATSEAYTVGQAKFEPPEMDTVSRPYVGLSEVADFTSFLDELTASGDLGSGGGDGPENTLGALKYANETVEWRDGAAHMFVAIGDNPSHTEDSVADYGWGEDFVPPTPEDLLAELSGVAIVHVVGNDYAYEPYYNLKSLADSTGGAFLQLPDDGVVDLTTLNLASWVTTSFTGVCQGLTVGATNVVIRATVTGESADYEGQITYEVSVE